MILHLLAQAADATARPFNTTPYTGTGAVRSLSAGVDASPGGLTILTPAYSLGFPFTDPSAFYDTVRGASRRARAFSTEDILSAFAFSGAQRVFTGANYNASGISHMAQHFQTRAGFLDIVPFTGGDTGVTHALGETPTMVMVVRRTGGSGDGVSYWFSGGTEFSSMTSGAFTPALASFPAGQTFVAYLFGIGSGHAALITYTGDGASSQNIAVSFAPKFIILTLPSGAASRQWDILQANTFTWGGHSGANAYTVSGSTLTALLAGGANTTSVEYRGVAFR